MKTHFIDSELKYDGTQLAPHFAYTNHNILGDSIVSFIGPCDVNLDHLVDLEDVKRKAPIYSESMLHFIVEHFEDDLKTVICYQRLLISLIQQELIESCEGLVLRRQGDDLFDEHHKLTVSIATASTTSCLIHTGINIISDNTPVPTKGLKDYGVNEFALATGVMNRYRVEMEGIKKARAKVRGV